jgi:hypothetical protein
MIPRYARNHFAVLQNLLHDLTREVYRYSEFISPWFPPEPWERIAVLTPISSPRSLTSAPPELPG